MSPVKLARTIPKEAGGNNGGYDSESSPSQSSPYILYMGCQCIGTPGAGSLEECRQCWINLSIGFSPALHPTGTKDYVDSSGLHHAAFLWPFGLIRFPGDSNGDVAVEISQNEKKEYVDFAIVLISIWRVK